MNKREEALAKLTTLEKEVKELRAIIDAPLDIKERVKSWDDVLKVSGRDAKEFYLRKDETEDELAYRKAKLIAEVLNEGTVLNAKDTSQYKYFPWLKIDGNSGSGLSYYVYGCWNANSFVGVRLCFKNSELAKYAFEIFPDVYASFLI